jgi:aromatic amino acid aminotransferase I
VSLGLKSVGVPMDDKGIVADELDRIMDDWDENARGGPRPKLLVLVP